MMHEPEPEVAYGDEHDGSDEESEEEEEEHGSPVYEQNEKEWDSELGKSLEQGTAQEY